MSCARAIFGCLFYHKSHTDTGEYDSGCETEYVSQYWLESGWSHWLKHIGGSWKYKNCEMRVHTDNRTKNKICKFWLHFFPKNPFKIINTKINTPNESWAHGHSNALSFTSGLAVVAVQSGLVCGWEISQTHLKKKLIKNKNENAGKLSADYHRPCTSMRIQSLRLPFPQTSSPDSNGFTSYPEKRRMAWM